MAVRGTKKPTKKANKPSGRLKKLPGMFSFRNPKSILLAAIVVGFAAGGSYWLYAESSAARAKDLTTVQGCEASGVILKAGPNNTVGSVGSCVKVVQTILNFYNYKTYGPSFLYLDQDGKYGPVTALAVGAYQQKDINGSQHAPERRPVTVDGIVGPQTWWWLHNEACFDIPTRIHACGDF